MAQKVQFVETVLRDANQSLIATRLPFSKFEPMLETIDKAGYYAVECWGGATFDVCLRYLNEDPWERLRKIRAKVPNTKLQMLLRGQNVLGYSHYPDDFVRLFVKKAVENGMDVIRIFDALNDVNNMKVAMEATANAGAIASGTISYTTSPVHNHKKYVEMVKELKNMGAGTICIKDMAGIMGPQEAYDLVSAIKDAVDMPIDLHTHSTTGLAFMTYLKAVEAGCDIIDTAISPFSGGTSQPATETLAYALRQLGYEVNINDEATKEIADYFKGIRDEFIADGTLMPKALATDTQCLTYQVPGGMLSNLLSQLKQMNALDKFDEALVSRRPSGLRKTSNYCNSLAHRTTWLRSDFGPERSSASAGSSGWTACRREPGRSGTGYRWPWPWEVGGQAVLGRQATIATPWLTERHGYDPTLPDLPGSRRYAFQPAQPAEADERPG